MSQPSIVNVTSIRSTIVGIAGVKSASVRHQNREAHPQWASLLVQLIQTPNNNFHVRQIKTPNSKETKILINWYMHIYTTNLFWLKLCGVLLCPSGLIIPHVCLH